jgi:hypothetical protein
MSTEIRPIISPVGPIYTTADTATLLQVSVRTVQRLIRDRNSARIEWGASIAFSGTISRPSFDNSTQTLPSSRPISPTRLV